MQKINADNPITPEDVGRVAIRSDGCERIILHVNSHEVCVENHNKDSLYIYNLNGEHEDLDYLKLTHWKPRTLQAPLMWWNVWRDKYGAIKAAKFNDCEMALLNHRKGIIARIYGHHWHGHGEGTFHTEEDAERIRGEVDNAKD